jgi:hypothetical protein
VSLPSSYVISNLHVHTANDIASSYKNRSPIHDRHDNLKDTLQRSRDSASLFVERMQHTWPSFNAEQSNLGWILAKLGPARVDLVARWG